MKKLTIILGVLLLAGGVWAQDDEEEYYERDVLELTFSGGVGIPGSGISDWSDTLGAKLGWQVGGEIGYFFTPSLVAGINLSYYQLGVDNDAVGSLKHRMYNPAVYMRYYFFGESDWVPYIRAQVGVANAKFTTLVEDNMTFKFRELSYDPALLLGAGAGIFWYRTDYSGLFLEANYYYAMTDDAMKEYKGTDYIFGENTGLLDIHLGFRVYFTKAQ